MEPSQSIFQYTVRCFIPFTGWKRMYNVEQGTMIETVMTMFEKDIKYHTIKACFHFDKKLEGHDKVEQNLNLVCYSDNDFKKHIASGCKDGFYITWCLFNLNQSGILSVPLHTTFETLATWMKQKISSPSTPRIIRCSRQVDLSKTVQENENLTFIFDMVQAKVKITNEPFNHPHFSYDSVPSSHCIFQVHDKVRRDGRIIVGKLLKQTEEFFVVKLFKPLYENDYIQIMYIILCKNTKKVFRLYPSLTFDIGILQTCEKTYTHLPIGITWSSAELGTCYVCLEKQLSVYNMCGEFHLMCCHDCFPMLEKCPMCYVPRSIELIQPEVI
jgi:hypothetical protein